MHLTAYRKSARPTPAAPPVVDGFIITAGRTWFGRRCVRARRPRPWEGWWVLTRGGLTDHGSLFAAAPELPDAVLVAMASLLEETTR